MVSLCQTTEQVINRFHKYKSTFSLSRIIKIISEYSMILISREAPSIPETHAYICIKFHKSIISHGNGALTLPAIRRSMKLFVAVSSTNLQLSLQWTYRDKANMKVKLVEAPLDEMRMMLAKDIESCAHIVSFLSTLENAKMHVRISSGRYFLVRK